jgi:hypothetical protein
VAWFPLGPREVFVPAYHVSPVYTSRINVVNVYNVTNVYVNRSVPTAVTAVSTTTFVSARPVHREMVTVDTRVITTAQVIQTAPVAPVRASLVGHVQTSTTVVAPPPAVLSRAVVARATPPPPPVAFERRRALYQQQPGTPIEPAAAQQLRIASPQRAYVRQGGSVNASAPPVPAQVTVQPQRFEQPRYQRPQPQPVQVPQAQPRLDRPIQTPQVQSQPEPRPHYERPAQQSPNHESPRNEQLRRAPERQERPVEKGREREPNREEKRKEQ